MRRATFLVSPINPRRPAREGETLPVKLEQILVDRTGHRYAGPHSCGTAEILDDERLAITVLLDTDAGHAAAGFLEDDVLDTVLWNGTVRLRVHNEWSLSR